MPIALLADAHLGGPGGSGDELGAQLEALSVECCERLVVLGDLFHVWVGYRRYETEELRRLLPVIQNLRNRGVPVHYIEGNRDFYLASGDYASCFDSIGYEYAFVSDGVRYLAVHGDGLNDRDWRYRFWRRASKNPLSRVVLRTLPFLGSRFLNRTDKRLSNTNFEHKKEIPEADIRRYAEVRLADAHDVLLLGHFHEPQRWSVTGGEVRVIDAWFRSRQLEWLSP